MAEMTNERGPQTTDNDRPGIRRATRAAAVGNFVEWFDFSLYGLLATVLATVFFPSDDPTSGLLSLFAVFGAAFVVRPLGAVFFGPLGDRIGRQRVLVIVISAMSLSTFLVGLLPARVTAGAWVTVALVALRLVQGFSAGGEIGGANTYLAEYAEPEKRAYRVSFTAASSLVAIATASALTFLLQANLSPEAMVTWGWRVPFLIAGPLGLVGLYIRLRLQDSPEFRQLEEVDDIADSPLREIVRKNRREILQSIGLACMLFVAMYIVTVYMATYLVRVLQMPPATATLSTVLTVLVAALLTPVFARASDAVGRKPILLGGCAGFALLGYPLFAILTPGAGGSAIAVHILLGCLLALLMGPSNVLMTELFPTRVRYSGASIGYNIAGAAFGGTAPFLATVLVAMVGPRGPALILVLAAIVTMISAATIRETAHRRSSTAEARVNITP